MHFWQNISNLVYKYVPTDLVIKHPPFTNGVDHSSTVDTVASGTAPLLSRLQILRSM